ncbi:Cullin family-domain-containing protein [Catenaria anguillulae PL171]|uniref:Cullin-5 n=1 Tax=Catenaria anguillulae PL171 TaxID=765915 RepID=A0A1Y2HD12_9FUNG|nr:Cullin family-domain-containing protein [Catenaria anguillulae PL171]
MDLYTLVYSMCNTRPKPMHEDLFLRIADFLHRHTLAVSDRILANAHQPLQAYATEWAIYLHAAQTLNIVCEVLNRAITAPLRGAPMSAAMKAFQDRRPMVGDSMYRRQSVESQLIGVAMDVVKMDREGVLGPHEACKALALSLVTLQAKMSHSTLSLYISDYESVFLAQTRAYYEQESRTYARDLTVSAFMRTAQDRLAQEKQRGGRYLHPSSLDKLLYECNAQYIDCHKDKIRGAFGDMLSSQFEQLAYSLLSHISGGIELLTQVYEKFVIAEGRKLVSPDPKTLVTSLGALHASLTSQITSHFHSDPKFVASMDMAYRTVINDSAVHAPKLIATFCDWLLRKANKQSDADIEQALTPIMTLFVYIDDKDVFHKCYARLLAKRLIQRLTHVTDMTLSAETSAGFRDAAKGSSAAVGLEVQILTAGTWPLSQVNVPPIQQLPEEVAQSVGEFSTSSSSATTSATSLTWLCTNGPCSHSSTRPCHPRPHPHPIPLPTMTRAAIASALGSPQHDADRTIDSLLDAHLLALTSDGAVTLNPAFSNKRTKLRLALTLGSGSKSKSGGGGGDDDDEGGTGGPAEDSASLEEDRKLYLQATMVRLLKTHRAVDHNALVTMVIEQAKHRFKPSVPLIKKCIEALMDKGYMEREGGAVGIVKGTQILFQVDQLHTIMDQEQAGQFSHQSSAASHHVALVDHATHGRHEPPPAPARPGVATAEHLAHQEQGFIAAAHRTDRTMDARIESAHRASEVHFERTGRKLLVTRDSLEKGHALMELSKWESNGRPGTRHSHGSSS